VPEVGELRDVLAVEVLEQLRLEKERPMLLKTLPPLLLPIEQRRQ
jgi:hypothetical protein